MGKKREATRWLILPDIHFPSHDKLALGVAMSALRKFRPHKTILLGDLVDCEPFSTHARRLLVQSKGADWYTEEIEPARKLLDDIQEHTEQETHYLFGNHEERIERVCSNDSKLQELAGALSIERNLCKGRKSFRWYPYTNVRGPMGSHVKIDRNLVAIHGWAHSKNAAAVHLALSKPKSIIYGHTHRAQHETTHQPWTDRIIEAMSPGCLTQLSPLYRVGGSPSDWSHGFAVVYVGQRSHTMYRIPIHKNYAILPDGTEVRA